MPEVDIGALRAVASHLDAAKLNYAFTERGQRDYYASHDLEDFLTIIDGRQRIVEEIDKSRSDMRRYLIGAFRSLLKQDEFNDALPGYLPLDSANQARLPLLRKKLKEIASLSDEFEI